MTETPELDLGAAPADLDEFIAIHYRRLLGLLTLKTGSRVEGEDLAQEALIKLVTNWPAVARMSNPWGWLATVAVNSSSSLWRKTLNGRKAVDRLAAMSAVRCEASDADVIDLLAIVRALPERQRKALVLRFYAQLSVRETADAMGCAEGTVKSLTHQAIRRMRADLQEEIDYED